MFTNVGRALPLITCLYKTYFYNIGFISSNDGLFTIQEMQLRGKARLLITWTSQGKLLDTWTLRISLTFGFLEGSPWILDI